ncbi:hypothetical protein PoB_000730500 [Plakobranchus ocellatus]|uniref:Uncharacterized protein n=1 Tax=Plakobranchus ocellatus TaxID=259542 RepID=A0AAV3YE60_9GAST|nr:hypothetical protein PoB_000730500 [Plakobranchus ocellatus]
MAPPFPLSNKATDVRPGCKTQRIASTLRQVANLVCARIKEREYFKTCIVGHVNCCLQCGLTLTATSVLQVSHGKSRRLQCGPTLTATSFLQVSHDKLRRLQCRLTLSVHHPTESPHWKQQFSCTTIHG